VGEKKAPITRGRTGTGERHQHPGPQTPEADHLENVEVGGQRLGRIQDLAGDGLAGGELGDYLARGHAIACATQFQLDVGLERWSASESGELEERVWLRFGKQLAASPLEEWECLGAVGSSGDRLTQLYLRLGKAVWWSFGAVLDRPSPEMVRKDGRGRSGRHSKLGLLRKVAERRCEPDRRALRRALRAIRARTGKPLDG